MAKRSISTLFLLFIIFIIKLNQIFAQSLHLIICIFAMMRALSFILAIYILALNFVPCEDDNCAVDEKVCLEEIDIHDTEHAHVDLCSPFCECQCCHMHATYNTPSNTLIASLEISTEVFSHFDSLGNDFTTTLLQPPRT